MMADNNATGFIFDDDNLKDVMKTVEGRKFVWELLDNAQIFQLAYAGEQTHATAFNEGRKYIGTLIFAQLQEICPELYLRMVKENTGKKAPETKLED